MGVVAVITVSTVDFCRAQSLSSGAKVTDVRDARLTLWVFEFVVTAVYACTDDVDVHAYTGREVAVIRIKRTEASLSNPPEAPVWIAR